MTKKYGPGIYFGMPFDEYLAIPAPEYLNNSGIKNLLVSCMDYWGETPMSPMYGTINTDTKAREEGRIFHKRILEGKEEFYKIYAPDYEDDKSDTTILRTVEDIKYALIKMGLGGTFKTKAAGAERLLSANPKARILHVLEGQHRAKFPGRIFAEPLLIRQTEFNASAIEYHPELRPHLAGGYPEATVIWYDEEFGVTFKIRFDYFKMQYGVDLKTYANQMRKKIPKAIAQEIARYQYHIQASLYMRGHRASKHLAAQGLVYGDHDPKWIKMFQKYETELFRFVFIKKGNSPVASGRRFWPNGDADKQGLALIREAVNVYHWNLKTHGRAPWIDMSPEEDVEMSEIPSYVNDL